MKWVAISGSWRKTNKTLENDVRKKVRQILTRNKGIITGGALGVDYIATDEALKQNQKDKNLIIFIPTTLKKFIEHYYQRAKEKVITFKQAESIINQLKIIKKRNSKAIRENFENKIVDKKAYYQRNSEIIKAADELVAFHVNNTAGVQDTINKAIEKGIPIKRFNYII